MPSPAPSEFNPYQAPVEAGVPLTGEDLEGLKPIPWVRAPLWRRFFAAVVDVAIGFVCMVAGTAVVFGFLMILAGIGEAIQLDRSGPAREIVFYVIMILMPLCCYGPFFAYFILMESSQRRGTFGKYLLDLAVVRTDGRRLTRGRSAARTLVKTFGILVYGVGLIWMFFNRNRQALHDRMTDTVVVLRDERDSS